MSMHTRQNALIPSAPATSARRRTSWPAVAALAVAFALSAVWLAPTPPARAAALAEADWFPGIRLEAVIRGLEQPLLVTHAPGDPESLFVVEKIGRIRRIVGGRVVGPPLVDIRNEVSTGYEQGLLSVAFHPRFQENRTFFINFTDRSGTTRIVRFQSYPDRYEADPRTRVEILRIPQPASNHNGGMMAFGPDGYLYIATGDGGRAGDPWGNAQNLGTLLGKMLRIDVDGGEPYAVPPDNPFVGRAGALPEIWAYGLRNPWRFSFDRETGDLYIADVGQGEWEEINLQPSGSPGGENYGWNITEGMHCYNPRTGCGTEGLTLPVAEYNHAAEGACSITGGYVYRGQAYPELRGIYFFGDFCSGVIYAMASPEIAGDMRRLPFVRAWQGRIGISSFGEDHDGELYVTDLSGGVVYRIVR